MTEPEPRQITCSHDENAKLEWAFNAINEFMDKYNLAVLRSKKIPVVMVYLGEDANDRT